MAQSLSAFRSALAAAALSALGCSSGVDVHSIQSPAAHFADYQTFTIEDRSLPPAEFSPSPQSADVRADIRESATLILQSLGYSPAQPDHADLLVRIEEGRRRRQFPILGFEHTDAAGRAEYQALSATTEEGAFDIDAFDRKTKELVWRGWARADVTPRTIDHARLLRAVESVLRAFPQRRDP
jgi:hypothetical protein